MEVRIDTIVPTPRSLLLGGQIRGDQDSWVRFVTIELPWDSISPEVKERIVHYSTRYPLERELADPLW